MSSSRRSTITSKPNAFRRTPQSCRTVSNVYLHHLIQSCSGYAPASVCVWAHCCVCAECCSDGATMSQVFHALLNDYKEKVFRNIFITHSLQDSLSHIQLPTMKADTHANTHARALARSTKYEKTMQTNSWMVRLAVEWYQIENWKPPTTVYFGNIHADAKLELDDKFCLLIVWHFNFRCAYRNGLRSTREWMN